MQYIYWLLSVYLTCSIMAVEAKPIELFNAVHSHRSKHCSLKKSCCKKQCNCPPGIPGIPGTQGPQGLPGIPGITVGDTFGYFILPNIVLQTTGAVTLQTVIATPNLVLNGGGVLILEEGDYLLQYMISGITLFLGAGGPELGLDMGISLTDTGSTVFPSSVYNAVLPNSPVANQQMIGQCILHLTVGQTIYLATSTNPNVTISNASTTPDAITASLRIRKIN